MALGAPIDSSVGPPPVAIQKLYDFAGGSNLVYIGFAMSDQTYPGLGNQGNLPSITSFTAANPGVITFSTAPGFNFQTAATTTPIIAISGGTGNWSAVNGVWVYVPTAATTGNIASVVSGSLTNFNTTGFGAVTGTLVVTTKAPRTSSSCWAIQKFVYNASNAVIFSGWAQNAPGAATSGDPAPGDPSRLVAGSVGMGLIWDNRANYSYQ